MNKKHNIFKNVWILLAVICVKPFFANPSHFGKINSTLKTNGLDCVKPDIEQFPKTYFSQNDRQSGAVIFHLMIGVYMFIALAIVCDEYFVPSLGAICQVFSIKEDIAGYYFVQFLTFFYLILTSATFMAAGSSAPELAATIISLFFAKDADIGIGTVVGSAVFNVMFVISIVSLLSGMIIGLSCYPVIRDSCFYLLSVLVMILIIMDERVYWYEGLSLLIMYLLYIIALIFDSNIKFWIYSKAGLIDQSEQNAYKTMKNSLTTEVNRLTTSTTMLENFETQSQKDDNDRFIDMNETIENFTPFMWPSSELNFTERTKFYICWPLFAILHLTVPDCRKMHYQKYFLITFIMSLVWLSLFSYIMVWMITVIGYTFSIPDTIMGITFIAFGASVPDALSSLLVAKNGQGDMAISNAIGSNVFDILVCLGIPWTIRSFTMTESFIVVKSKGLTYSSITLFGTVVVLVAALKINKWQLDKRLGFFLLFVYFLFIILASLYEFNIFGSSQHLPMCTNSLW